MAFSYPGYSPIPRRPQASLLDLVNSFEEGFDRGETRRQNRQGIDAAYEYGSSVPQWRMPEGRQPMLSDLARQMTPEQQYADQRVKTAHAAANDRNPVFADFMRTVQAGGVTNPAALAAIAATGTRESGFSNKNAFGSWSDPSQSGEPGTSGGIMSWRGERLANMQRFATEQGDDPQKPSAATQAKFLLSEDPALIQKLNSAKSPAEAAQMMAQAWRFAGYNQPGGEAAQREQLAQSMAPQFGGAEAEVQPGQQGGMLSALVQGALGAEGLPMPSREQFAALMRSELTRPIGQAILQARMTGNRDAAAKALDLALRLDKAQGGFTTPQQGVDAQGNPIFFQADDRGNKRVLEGITPNNPIKTIDTGTEVVTVDSRTGAVISRTPKQNYQESFDKGRGQKAGSERGEAEATLESMSSKMPGLQKVVGELDTLAETATYNFAQRARDTVGREMGLPPSQGALARAEYIAKIDNQILPLLRDTFGAQFTQREGETLRATLGDANKSPKEKQAVLKAFILQKQRDIEALRTRIGTGGQNGADNDPLGLR